jgi:hypothetical protein
MITPSREEECRNFYELVKAHKTKPVGGVYLAERLCTSHTRIQALAASCNRIGLFVVATRGYDGSNGYDIGGLPESLKMVNIGDKIEIFDTHFEDANDLPKTWKQFTILDDCGAYYLLKTKNGVRSTLLKCDMYDGHVRIV